ncbi:ABC transporter permease [Candidatus Methanoperedens nitratireducens]|uniref:ABC transporter permease n=1 Tax=Candidatus Methanoperedens nitratireducens TaxID=1392998 RepID=UPI0011787546|nr:ABC transporter permease [Candidatus Methanoperedens nitroreducens]
MALTIGSVIRKDLKVYVRHRKTLLLIFIAPILIMILIGSVFSGASGEGLKDVRLGVGGGSGQGERITRELTNNSMFIIVKENTTDPAVIEEGVRKGKYNAGIFIPEDETQSLRLYIDNSRIQIAPVISMALFSTTEKLSYELTFGFISTLWKNLAQMESELKPLKEGVLQINRSIEGLNRDTRHVLVSLDDINISELNRSVAGMNNTLYLMRSDLIRTADDINTTRKELKELDNNVSSIYNDSVELRDDLKFVIDNIDSTDAALLGIQTDLQDTYNVTCTDPSTPQCVSIAGTIRQIQDTRALMLERTGRIRALYNNLANITQKSAELHEKLNRTDIRLQVMQQSIGNYTLEISNIQGDIMSIENAITSLQNVKTRSANVSIQVNDLASDMANSTAGLVSDIDRTGDVLGEVIARSPAVIASPVKLEQDTVFKGRSYLDFLMPGIISIVLMFVSFLLASITIVQERSKKTLVRTLLTPLSLEGFIIAKISALVLIALLQGIILIIVAFAFYGIVVPVDQLGLLFLVILAYSVSFIGIGMALATFAESENTAMLLSLVLSIPMLFLCGIFFPFESMPALMVWLGGVLPITMGIRALESVLIYQEGFRAITGYLLPLLLYGVAGLGTAYLLLRREVTD